MEINMSQFLLRSFVPTKEPKTLVLSCLMQEIAIRSLKVTASTAFRLPTFPFQGVHSVQFPRLSAAPQEYLLHSSGANGRSEEHIIIRV